MINVISVEGTPAGILFGQPTRGGQQAAWFAECELEGARKAKNGKTLACLAPIPPGLDAVVEALARGRVEGGQVALGKAAPDLYAKLLAAKSAERSAATSRTAQTALASENGGAASTPAGQADPAAPGALAGAPPADGWEQLKVGDLVIARWGVPDEGWWPARVVKIEGDSFTLAWVAESEPLARRTRAQLALVHPKMA